MISIGGTVRARYRLDPEPVRIFSSPPFSQSIFGHIQKEKRDQKIEYNSSPIGERFLISFDRVGRYNPEPRKSGQIGSIWKSELRARSAPGSQAAKNQNEHPYDNEPRDDERNSVTHRSIPLHGFT